MAITMPTIGSLKTSTFHWLSRIADQMDRIVPFVLSPMQPLAFWVHFNDISSSQSQSLNSFFFGVNGPFSCKREMEIQ